MEQTLQNNCFSLNEIEELLNREAARINSPEFIADDPVQFPRMFDRKEDIEIASLLAATIAWGNRKMICNDCRKMFSLMDWKPLSYVLEKGYEELPDMNIHRTFFARDLRAYLRGLHRVYARHGSLEAFAAAENIALSEVPAWSLVEALNRELHEANNGFPDANLSRCLPQNLKTTALKRVNMALRWLVRNDGIVDLGVWDVIKPSQLFIPLDVHVGNTARDLGLISRKANDRRTVMELMEPLKAFNPSDPVIYDYALFGLGIESKKAVADS